MSARPPACFSYRVTTVQRQPKWRFSRDGVMEVRRATLTRLLRAWRKADCGRCRNRVGADSSCAEVPSNLEWLAPTNSATPRQRRKKKMKVSQVTSVGGVLLKHSVVLLGRSTYHRPSRQRSCTIAKNIGRERRQPHLGRQRSLSVAARPTHHTHHLDSIKMKRSCEHDSNWQEAADWSWYWSWEQWICQRPRK